MAKFLNTSAINYHLENLINNSNEKVILISPYLQLNDRIKEILVDKNKLKIDIRIIYGKSKLKPSESNWLNNLEYIRTSFCKNLHAKCYMNEETCIISSLNLYQFSQVNNKEMGILLTKKDDAKAYQDTYDETQRIIRSSDDQEITAEKSHKIKIKTSHSKVESIKISSSKIALKLKLKTDDFLKKMLEAGYLKNVDGKKKLTENGKNIGGEFKYNSKHGPYFIWPKDLKL